MKSTIAYATGFAFALALPAVAATSLSLDGLDASKAEDVAALSAKLDAAVKQACRGKGSGVQLVGNKRMTCKDMAKDRAVSKLPEEWRTALAAPAKTAKPAGAQVADRW